jgi:hypothetical protein
MPLIVVTEKMIKAGFDVMADKPVLDEMYSSSSLETLAEEIFIAMMYAWHLEVVEESSTCHQIRT